jgi:hypothetical protein
MRTTKVCSALLLLLSFSLLAASQVRADGINYSYTSGGNTFTWTLPTNPVVAPGNGHLGEGFTLPGVSFLENGTPMIGTLDFFNSASVFGGGFDLHNGLGYLINAFGPQLYIPPETAPTMTMSLGTFSFVDYGSDVNGTSPPSVTQLQVTSVPEPSTLSLLAIGLAIGLLFFYASQKLVVRF